MKKKQTILIVSITDNNSGSYYTTTKAFHSVNEAMKSIMKYFDDETEERDVHFDINWGELRSDIALGMENVGRPPFVVRPTDWDDDYVISSYIIEDDFFSPVVPEGFVDLGLPSGTLWAEKQEDGYYTYDEAQAKYGEAMPQPEEFVELWRVCKWKWNKKKKGCDVTGPNGNNIFLAASGYRVCASEALVSVGNIGHYWSAAPDSADYACNLSFDSGLVYPLSSNYRAIGFSVVLVRRTH